jgi:hypothetical protein
MDSNLELSSCRLEDRNKACSACALVAMKLTSEQPVGYLHVPNVISNFSSVIKAAFNNESLPEGIASTYISSQRGILIMNKKQNDQGTFR